MARLYVDDGGPVDPILGIGLAANDPSATYPAQWRGLNLLGFALMQVRSALSTASPSHQRNP